MWARGRSCWSPETPAAIAHHVNVLISKLIDRRLHILLLLKSSWREALKEMAVDGDKTPVDASMRLRFAFGRLNRFIYFPPLRT